MLWLAVDWPSPARRLCNSVGHDRGSLRDPARVHKTDQLVYLVALGHLRRLRMRSPGAVAVRTTLVPDPEQNGGRSLEDLLHHIADDDLVG